MDGEFEDNYTTIGQEASFDVLDLDGQSFHPDGVLDEIIVEQNNIAGTGMAKNDLAELNSNWMSQFTSIGTSRLSEQVDGMGLDINDWYASNIPDEFNLSSVKNSNEVQLNKFLNEQAGHLSEIDTGYPSNEDILIGKDFALSKQHDLERKDRKSAKKRKSNETLTGVGDLNLDVLLGKISKNGCEELADFDTQKLVDNGRIEDLEFTHTDRAVLKRAKLGDDVDGSRHESASFASAVFGKEIKSTSDTGRGRRRNSRTRNRRSEARIPSKCEDLSPVPSPEAEVPCLSPIDTTEYIKDEELINLETKELNKRVKHYSKDIVDEIKHRRRTLKNRGYARSCREKKINETSTLQNNNEGLQKKLASTRIELKLAILQRDEWKSKYENLVSDIKRVGNVHMSMNNWSQLLVELRTILIDTNLLMAAKI